MEQGSTVNLLPQRAEGVTEPAMRSVAEIIKKTAANFCTVKTLKRKIPIIEWLPKYRLELLIQDMIAGISVGLTAIPQGIAYAGVAGLPLQYGLYSGFMGCFVYLLLGSCKDLTIGPTAILALMTQKYVSGYGADFAVLLTFLSGWVILLLGLFNLGFIIDFISMPVTTGFTTAAAITIAFTQLHSLLGLHGKSNTFLDVWINFVKYFDTINLWDFLLGIVTIVILLLLRELRRVGSRTSQAEFPVYKNILYKFNWLLSLSRNAIVIILGCIFAYILEQYDLKPFTLTGEVDKGLPPFGPPPFSTVDTDGVKYNFLQMVEHLDISILTIALISILEAVAIAKAFSNGKIVDSTQEMIALGTCNILGSFVRSMPTTGSFTRTVINNTSGVQTTLGGVFTGVLVLLSLGFLTSSFYYIPKAVLAGLIISAMVFMVEFEVIPLFWRTRKLELLPFFGTVLTCLFIGLEIGILVGVVLNILMILATAARPSIYIQLLKVNCQDVLVVKPQDSLLFCSADHFSKSVSKVVFSKEQIHNTSLIIIIDASLIKNLDITVAKSFKILLKTFESRQQKVFLWRFNSTIQGILAGVHFEAAEMFVDSEEMDQIVDNHLSAKASQSLEDK